MVNHLEQLRQFIAAESWPINIKDWPIELNEETNCLAFALGLPFADVNRDTFRFWQDSNLGEKLEKWFSSLGLVYRKINSDNDANNDEIIIQCFEFTSPIYRTRDYHVIRRNLNGTWVHKLGWKEAPCEITNWNDALFWFNYLEHSVYTYAVKKKIN